MVLKNKNPICEVQYKELLDISVKKIFSFLYFISVLREFIGKLKRHYFNYKPNI